MNGISTLLCALQQALDEVSSIEGVVLILGGSLVRPLFVYDITISHGTFDSGSAKDQALTKVSSICFSEGELLLHQHFPLNVEWLFIYDLFLVKHWSTIHLRSQYWYIIHAEIENMIPFVSSWIWTIMLQIFVIFMLDFQFAVRHMAKKLNLFMFITTFPGMNICIGL